MTNSLMMSHLPVPPGWPAYPVWQYLQHGSSSAAGGVQAEVARQLEKLQQEVQEVRRENTEQRGEAMIEAQRALSTQRSERGGRQIINVCQISGGVGV